MDRRTLLLGSAGLVIAGCSGGGSESPPPAASPKGPNIVKPRTGNVVTEADTVALRDQLNAAMKSGKVDNLVAIIDPDDFAIEDFAKRWSRRLENFDRLGFIEGEWYVGAPGGRTRNASGGKVEYNGDLVFAHTVRGCDGQQVVESMRATFRKATTDSPLELLHVGEIDESFDPSFWDVATIDAIETEHAWIVFRTGDADVAKAHASRIQAGAKRAFELMPRPKGVDKVFYALTWPEIDGKLWGGVAVGDALAHAYYHPFLDPSELANGQKKASSATGLPLATGRVGMHDAALAAGADSEATACHEAMHVLANQWYVSGEKATWAIEGFAEWGEKGASLLPTQGAMIRSTFGQFESVALKGHKAFYDQPQTNAYYQCAAAVFACLEAEEGRDAVFQTAEAIYGSTSRQEAEEKMGRTEKELMAMTGDWLRA